MAREARSERAMRSKPMTAAELKAIAARLQNAATALESQAEKMKHEKIEKINVEGHSMLDNAFEWINNFYANCVKGIQQF